MNQPKTYRFYLDFSPERWLAHYRGHADQLVVRASCGTRVQIPTKHFTRFVQHSGLQGWFELQLDRHNRMTALHRLQA